MKKRIEPLSLSQWYTVDEMNLRRKINEIITHLNGEAGECEHRVGIVCPTLTETHAKKAIDWGFKYCPDCGADLREARDE